ncbi:MAG: sulfotransferase family protein [Planctomycetota bacterium]|jgi:hypothetical protein
MPTSIELHRTECITFPRSGHTLLHRVLEAYFGADVLRYCELYEQPHRQLDLDDRTRFQKNHDLDLRTPVHPDRRYVVQVRYPVESIVSWFRLACERGQANDDPNHWTSFAIQKAALWMGFYRRWVLNHVPQRLVVNYDDLVSSPVEVIGQVIRHLGDQAPDEARLEAICGAERIGRRSTIRGFKYYGPGFFTMFTQLFAAVPGIDVEDETLTVPAALVGEERGPDALLGTLARELHETSVTLESIGRRLETARVAVGTAPRLAAVGA